MAPPIGPEWEKIRQNMKDYFTEELFTGGFTDSSASPASAFEFMFGPKPQPIKLERARITWHRMWFVSHFNFVAPLVVNQYRRLMGRCQTLVEERGFGPVEIREMPSGDYVWTFDVFEEKK
tara:strand:- start:762 stop:1124 length:363 start_codon:yes stop_codon:yes gene_type:complete